MSDWGSAAFVAGALLLALAVLLVVSARGLKRRSGLPTGRVLHSDMGGGRPKRSLYSEQYGLSGSPDYVIGSPHGPIPVEVKPGRTEREPRESHLLQVLAYCLLVEESEGKAPPYGLLRYSNETFKVDYNPETRAYLLSVVEEMRKAEGLEEVHRSHEIVGRCRGCAYNAVCEESLWVER